MGLCPDCSIATELDLSAAAVFHPQRCYCRRWSGGGCVRKMRLMALWIGRVGGADNSTYLPPSQHVRTDGLRPLEVGRFLTFAGEERDVAIGKPVIPILSVEENFASGGAGGVDR